MYLYFFSHQLYISAYDTDAESEKGYATLRIFITRNLQPPTFVPSGQLNFVEFIIDHQPMGTVVINMTATDADITVSYAAVC